MEVSAEYGQWRNVSKWIWIPGYDDSVNPGQFVLFRKKFHLKAKPTSVCYVRVSADTRYRLFVNGKSVSFGPCKSYPSRWYYETVDISSCLAEGENVFSAKVLRYSNQHPGNSSMIRTATPGFILHASIEDSEIYTDKTWKTKWDPSIKLLDASSWNYILGPPFMNINEECDGSLASVRWTEVDFDDNKCTPAVPTYSKVFMMPILSPWPLAPRPIPLLPENLEQFDKALKSRGEISLDQWNTLLKEKRPVEIPANSHEVVELESAVLTTGFLQLATRHGKGAVIKITCAEAYEKDLHLEGPSPLPMQRFKADRADISGELYGPVDTYTVGGDGYYEPFWFRTFRYIRLEISTKDEPLSVRSFDYRDTHYPLEIRTEIETTPELDSMWKISLNTLRNCMHETYEDCPFYEQNQFAMDARAQILFTYQLSRDDRLARKCMQEFYASRREDGLIETHFPVPFRVICIPQFSLYWIMMVYDHMMYFGDKNLVKRYIGTVDGIFDYFDQRINEDGLVGQFHPEMWPYIDWVKEWQGTQGLMSMGIPPAYRKGAATYNSLVYAMVLNHAAELCGYIRRFDTGKEYRRRATELNEAVNKHCFDGEMYVDGPSVKDRCQHTQIFAVLAGAITGSRATDLIRQTIGDTSLPQCSYAMSFYVFRAVEKVGLYNELFSTILEPYRKMMRNNLTTWAEDNDVMFRSDCHAWGASPIYETVKNVFGLYPGKPGYYTVHLKPNPQLFESARGKFVTDQGEILITWQRGKQSTELALEASSDMTVDLEFGSSSEACELKKGQKVTKHLMS